MNDHLQHPEFNGGACILTASPLAQCTSCIDICPRNALLLDDYSLYLDNAICDGCGLCRSACPEGAVHMPINLVLREDREKRISAFLVCSRVGDQYEEGMVSCLHAVGMRDLEDIAEEGVTQIVIANCNCQTCPRNSNRPLEQTLENINALRQSRGKSIIRLNRLPVTTWRHEISASREYTKKVDQGRRQFLRFATGAKETQPGHPVNSRSVKERQEEWIYAALPEIDGTKCNGCNACIHVCPHGVLTLSKVNAEFEYKIDPDQCTGCNLCKDVCDQNAITLQSMSKLRQANVSLRKGRCSICSTDFHVPREAERQSDKCPICAQINHHHRLFQVLD